MLIPNLRKPEYINIVLDGHLDHLAEKFAEAHRGRSYTAWRWTNPSLNLWSGVPAEFSEIKTSWTSDLKCVPFNAN